MTRIVLHSDCRRRAALASAMTLALAACGGGGTTHVAPTPPLILREPQNSVYDLFASREYVAISTGYHTGGGSDAAPIHVSVDGEALTYTLTLDDPASLVPEIVFHPAFAGGGIPYQDQVKGVLPDGTTYASYLWLGYNALPYVNGAEWYHSQSSPDGEGWYRSDYFVYGLRTAPSDLPVSGVATFEGRTDGSCDCWGSATLTADFGAGEVAARIAVSDVDYAVDMSGSGPISSDADFGFALSGQAQTFATDTSPASLDDTTGSLSGAFFGPGAENVGGVFSVVIPTSEYDLEGSFTAAR